VTLVDAHYIQFLNLVMDCYYGGGTCVAMTDVNNHHIRLSGNEIKNTGRQYGGLGSESTPFNTNGITGAGLGFNEIINNKIHDNGNGGYDHGIYGCGDNCLIDGNEIYHNAGHGIHKYPSGNNEIIRNNRIHDNGQSGFLGATRGGGSGI